MTRPRRNAWRAHICDVVLDYLGAPSVAPASKAAAPRAARKRAA